VFTALALAAHPGGPGFGFGWIFFVLIPLFWVGVIILIASIGRRRWSRGGFGPGAWGHGHWAHAGHGPWGAGARGAESTLAERFAQGDIDEKEYRARLEVLRANNTFTPPST
jgi:putative membrane protein